MSDATGRATDDADHAFESEHRRLLREHREALVQVFCAVALHLAGAGVELVEALVQGLQAIRLCVLEREAAHAARDHRRRHVD